VQYQRKGLATEFFSDNSDCVDYSRLNEPFSVATHHHFSLIFLLSIIIAFTRLEKKISRGRLLFHFD
jgi:hypothetical protein